MFRAVARRAARFLRGITCCRKAQVEEPEEIEWFDLPCVVLCTIPLSTAVEPSPEAGKPVERRLVHPAAIPAVEPSPEAGDAVERRQARPAEAELHADSCGVEVFQGFFDVSIMLWLPSGSVNPWFFSAGAGHWIIRDSFVRSPRGCGLKEGCRIYITQLSMCWSRDRREYVQRSKGDETFDCYFECISRRFPWALESFLQMKSTIGSLLRQYSLITAVRDTCSSSAQHLLQC